jgi:peptide/nickel transport system permease protein
MRGWTRASATPEVERVTQVAAEVAGSWAETSRRERGWLSRSVGGIGRFARKKPLGAVTGALIVLVVLMAVFAPLLAPKDPTQTSLIDSLRGPSAEYPLGTDRNGRDMLSRIIYGARVSLGIGLGAVALGIVIGATVGVVGGFLGGAVDMGFQRGVDMLLAFPTIVLAMAIVAAAGISYKNIIIAIGITLIPGAARVVRSAVLTVRELAYVDAARSLGATDLRLMLRHVLPNVAAPIIVLTTVVIGQAIIAEATLSFLGLGIQEPRPSWGSMLSGNAQRHIEDAPWLVIFPGLALALVVFAFNMFGDALRDVLDPRLRGSR